VYKKSTNQQKEDAKCVFAISNESYQVDDIESRELFLAVDFIGEPFPVTCELF
jgi:hypothetical protein